MNWTPLSKRKHTDLGVTRNRNYTIFRDSPLVHICAFELQNAAASVPLVFANDNGNIRFVGVLGLKPAENLFVDASGNWKLDFMPAKFQVYPFRLAQFDDGNVALLFLEGNNVLVNEGERDNLFSENGEQSDILRYYINLLANVAKSDVIVSGACKLLNEFGLLEPFNILARPERNVEKPELGAILKLNVPNFEKLSDSQFLKLRSTRALDIIFAHLFSLRRFSTLYKLVSLAEENEVALKDLGQKIFENEFANLNFDFEKLE